MTFIIYIRKNATGEIRKIVEHYEFTEFYWSEGNMSCDCNRARAFDNYENWFDCGKGGYDVVDVHNLNGERTEEMKKFLTLTINNF